MIWVAFAAGFVLGGFSGMLVLGLIREMAASRSGCAKEPFPGEAQEAAAPIGEQVPV